MVNTKLNQIKTLNPAIRKIVKEGRYDADDVTEAERIYVEKHRATPRVRSVVLARGDLVAVLEGAHMGRKGVVVRQLDNFKAIVAVLGPHGSVFKIDERYLFKLDTRVEIPEFNLNADDVYESTVDESEKVEADPSTEEKTALSQIGEAVSKVPYLKAYLAEPFKVDHSAEFYSLKY